jgi:hypothetical protein
MQHSTALTHRHAAVYCGITGQPNDDDIRVEEVFHRLARPPVAVLLALRGEVG